ncbi:MAG: alpha-hydroxy-acid oxidizing protein [Caulobacteraceae bacterium]|nr:alpha-hydroxy-acid oxidizing protein [Caulobacteraceae bacterium]
MSIGSGFGAMRQGEVYLRGVQGERPDLPFTYADLEALAKRRMSPEAWAYIAGGAGRETTIDANRAALDAAHIVPRMAIDAGSRDLSTTLLGRRMEAPFLTCPIGVTSMAHAEADLAVAKGAAAAGATMIISNQASRSIEDICATASGPKWFQLYWGKSEDLVQSLMNRAKAAGCEAIVITLDTTILGWRCRDLDLGHLPFLKGDGIAQYTSDPWFRSQLADPPEKNPFAAAALFTQIFSDPSLSWEKLKTIRRYTDLPVLLKGIQHPEDAGLAVEHGFDGVVVSNHGGRQVDGATGSFAQLDACVERVSGRIPVLFDSGVRTGADAFKALARGADAVCIGRPWVYGLALKGAEGVEAVLKNIIAELDLTMALTGCRTLADIRTATLR